MKNVQESEKKRLNLNRKQVLTILFLEIIIISYLFAFYFQITARKTSYYMKHVDAQLINVNEQIVEHPVSFCENGIVSYGIDAVAVGNEDTVLCYALLDQLGNTILEGKKSVPNIQKNQRIILKTKKVELKKDHVYNLKLWCVGEGNVQIQEYEGKLIAKETYTFMYARETRIFCIICAFVSLGIFLGLVLEKRFWVKFVVIAVFIHFFQNTASIPCSAPDDFRHFLRAYDIASGNLRCKEYNTDADNKYNQAMPVIYMPEEYAELTDLSEESSDEWWAETNRKVFLPKLFAAFSKSESDHLVECAMLATNTISPIAYAPQVIMIFLAKLVKMPPVIVYYMARAGNFLFSLIMIILSIKMVEKRKNLLMVLYFLPGMNLLRASCSTDGVLYACTLMMFALFLRMWDERRVKFHRKEFFIVLALTIVIASVKVPYILMTFIFMFLPMQDTLKHSIVSERKWQILRLTVCIVIICGLSYTIYAVGTKYFSYVETALLSVDSINYFKANIVQTLNFLFQNMLDSTFSFIQDGICGQITGAGFVVFCYIVLVVWVAGIERGEREIDGMARVGLLCVMTGIILAIYFIFFMNSAPGSGEILGVQGRYFLPVAILGVAVLPAMKKNCENITEYAYLYSFGIGMMEVCCSLLYYIG